MKPSLKIPVSCVFAALFLTAMGGPAVALSPQEVFARVAPAVAVLEVRDGEGRVVGRYSATRWAAGRFVTVCETLDGAASLHLGTGPQPLPARVVARDSERNLCLLAADGDQGPALPRARPSAPGGRVFAVSNALGLGVGISEGMLSGVRRFAVGDYVQFSAPISPGSEGGALVDELGALVGIIDYRRRDGQNVNFASLAAWGDEIEGRAALRVEQQQRYAAASALLKAEGWSELQTLSADWARREPDSADAWRFAVSAARGLRQGDKELEAWRALWRISPDRPDVAYGLGQALVAAGQAREALTHAQALVAGHREYAPARLLVAQLRHGAGQYREAEAAYRETIDLDPWQMPAYWGLADLARLRGDHATSISLYTRLASLYPEAPGPRYGLTQAYLNANKPERAYGVLARLPDKDKDDASTWYWRGVVEARLGRPEAAIRAFRESLARDLQGPDRAWVGLGLAYYEMKRFPEAIAAFEAARSANPAEAYWDYQLGVMLKDGGRPQEALTRFQALAAQAPDEARNWRQVGFTLSILNRQEEAAPALVRSLQIDPAQAKVWAALIEVQRLRGRRDEALDAYDKLRAVDGKAAEEAWRVNFAAFEDKGGAR